MLQFQSGFISCFDSRYWMSFFFVILRITTINFSCRNASKVFFFSGSGSKFHGWKVERHCQFVVGSILFEEEFHIGTWQDPSSTCSSCLKRVECQIQIPTSTFSSHIIESRIKGTCELFKCRNAIFQCKFLQVYFDNKEHRSCFSRFFV